MRLILPLALAFLAAYGCARSASSTQGVESPPPETAVIGVVNTPSPTPKRAAEPALRYIFLFIGDGMGQNQILAAAEAREAAGLAGLSFLDFPVRGTVLTGSASDAITDSAAAATAIACGVKTKNDMLGLDEEGARLTTIAETLRGMGRKIAILTTVSLDHATPAGFFAHVSSRRSYAMIADDLFASGFDYFSGGGFHSTPNAAALAEENGYALCTTLGEAAASGAARLIYASDQIIGDYGLTPAIDGGARIGLAGGLRLAIERLDSEAGFFMMAEGGRIDYFCHYHDAGSFVSELYDFDDAISIALSFYAAHPLETLILVTADHETGDLSLLEGDRLALLKQTVSCDTCDDTLVLECLANGTAAETALPQFCALFGLDETTADEIAYLSEAYRHTLANDLTKSQSKAQYGVYAPITSACANLVAKRAGLRFGSAGHTAANVPLYALGVGQEFFTGTYENTAIYDGVLAALAAYPPE